VIAYYYRVKLFSPIFMRTSFTKFFTSPPSPPCEGGENGVVNSLQLRSAMLYLANSRKSYRP